MSSPAANQSSARQPFRKSSLSQPREDACCLHPSSKTSQSTLPALHRRDDSICKFPARLLLVTITSEMMHRPAHSSLLPIFLTATLSLLHVGAPAQTNATSSAEPSPAT